MKIEFKIPNDYNKYLFKIFENINLSDCIFFISEDEVIDRKGNYIFTKSVYDYNEFQQIVRLKDYYLMFLKIQLYKETINNKIINNYQDFLNSDCELIIFITDCQFIQIYCKNNELFDHIYNNVLKNGFTDIKDIKNVRKSFSSYDD